MVMRDERVDFLAPVDGWTPDDYVIEFWYVMQGYVTKQFGPRVRGSNVTVDDVQSTAGEMLLDFARDFDGICKRMGATPHDKRLFWHLAKRRINWAMADYLTAFLRYDASVEVLDEVPTRAWKHSNSTRYLELSSLHQQLVARLTALLPPVDQMILALYFYEELPRTTVASIVGLSQNTVGARIRTASARILHAASSLVTTLLAAAPMERAPWDQTSASTWTRAHYDVDVDAYLAWVTVAYRSDVSYLVDILGAGNGELTRHHEYATNPRLQARSARFTDDQVNDIRDRIDAGEKYATIMRDFGVSDATISSIKHGRTYAYVPRREGTQPRVPLTEEIAS